MNEVLQKTRELGEAILRSDVYQSMKALEVAAMGDMEAANAMAGYLEKKQTIEAMLADENPDAEALKRLSDELDDIQEKLKLIGTVQALTDARGRFAELIEEVNNVLRFIVTRELQGHDDSESDCGGCENDCDSCQGCCGHLH